MLQKRKSVKLTVNPMIVNCISDPTISKYKAAQNYKKQTDQVLSIDIIFPN